MNLKDFPPSMKFIFMSMMKSAMIMKNDGFDKKFFMSFAEEIWTSMEMQDLATLEGIMTKQMKEDIEPYVEKYIKSRKG